MRCPSSRRPWARAIARPLVVAILAAPACATPGGGQAPPPATGTRVAPGVAAAHPLAVDAGLRVLAAGGSAVDAAVAVQAMLGLVEPQSSGIGGGGFLMHYEARTGRVTMFDGRETAPAAADSAMFLDARGAPLPFNVAVVSGRATGVPGVMAMLGMAHERFGRRPWSALFEDVARTADTGFVVPRRLGRFANGSNVQARQPDAVALLAHPEGRRIRAGDTFRNPAYARTLRALATRGPRALLEGDIARAIVARLREGEHAGLMTVEDLAAYQPVERTPLCGPYRVHVICVPPPPSSGVSLLQLLAMLDRTDIASRGPEDPQSWFLFAEASRLMYADRDRYVADPAFVEVPVTAMLDTTYLRARVARIGERAMPAPPAGEVGGARPGADGTVEAAGTSHFIVVDREGNAVSMTTTVESLFGSGRVVGGFFLNNQMTDFSFTPVEGGRPVANAVGPRKRPRSSMTPAIVLDREGRFVGAFGSPGGSAILAYNGKLALAMLGWGLPVQQGIDLPNLFARGERFNGEASRFPATIREALAARGVTIVPGDGEDSGLHGVLWRGAGTEGGADTRRDGTWRVLPPD